MSLYEANLSLFKGSAPQLYQILTEEPPVFDVSLEVNAFSHVMLQTDKTTCFLHSLYSIDNEMQQMFQSVDLDTDTIILYGIGNGHAIDYIIENCKAIKSLIIIEPSLAIFKNCIELFDFKKLFDAKWSNEVNFTFITNREEGFAAELTIQQGLRGEKNSVVVHPYIFSGFMNFYQQSNKSLLKYLKIYVGGIATVSSQWKLWLLNSIRNLKQSDIIPIENIQSIFKDKVVLIVSAGPSLNNNIEYIKAFKGKAIVLAVGSAIKVLDTKSIVPDFRVVIDAFEGQMDVVEGVDTASAPMLFSNQLFNGVIPVYKSNKVRYVLDSDFIGKYVYKKAGLDYVEFKNGPSVANGAVDLACSLGCKKVIFMGQDLSYAEDGLHAKGVIAKAEKADKEWVESQNQIKMLNVYGKEVYTVHALLQMKFVLEKTISRYPDVEFLNATEGGLHIEGTIDVKADEAVKLLELEQANVDLDALNLRLSDRNEKELYTDKLHSALEIVKDELSEITKLQNEIIHFLSELKNKKDRSSNSKERELLYIDNLMGRLNSYSFYRDVIEHELRADLLGIRRKFATQLASGRMKAQDKEMYLTGICNKITEHIELCTALLEENTQIK